MDYSKSKKLFNEAKKHIPGGVNSPVRAFSSVGGTPLFIKKAKGAYIYDEDDNKYVELFNSWGPMILGHNNQLVAKAVKSAVKNSLSFGAPTRKEVEIAELIIDMVPSIETVRMVNSGTEATMSAVRVARGFTGRDKIIKFEGCYHGHGDSFLIAAGSGAMTLGVPNSPGVTEGTVKDTLLAPFNNLEALQNVVDMHKGQVAAIIIEPVAGNMGCVLPRLNYLQGIRDLCTKEGIVLIFDEVMTGFRLAKGGAQERFGVIPDMTTLGKIIGAGMPVGAYGGRKEIMNYVSPAGPVYQAGTLSGNPIAMSAGIAMLTYLNEHDEVYEYIDNLGIELVSGIRRVLLKHKLKYTINQIGSMYSLFFTDEEVYDLESAKKSDTKMFGKYFHEMLSRGVYLPPAQFESLFLSTAIQEKHVRKIIKAHDESIAAIHNL